MTAIEVVLFDLDDTLFEHTRAVRIGVAAHRLANDLAGDEAEQFARWSALEEHHYHRYLSGETGFREQRRARARDFVAPYGLDLTADDAADEWFGHYLIEYQRAWRLHDDVLPLLDLLTQRLGIITNAELEFQLGKLNAMAVTERFEHVIASGIVGAAKPDPEIFRFAAAAYSVEPARVAYVGDRFQTDAIGASNAGMLGIWLDRTDAATAADRNTATEQGVAIIRSLAELPAVLAGADLVIRNEPPPGWE